MPVSSLAGLWAAKSPADETAVTPSGIISAEFISLDACCSGRAKYVGNELDTTVRDIASEDDQYQRLLEALCAVRDGDFTVQLPVHWDGMQGKIAACFNEIVGNNRHLASELSRVGQKVGRERQTRKRIAAPNRTGCWLDMQQSVNLLIDDLVRPVETMNEAMAGVAQGG